MFAAAIALLGIVTLAVDFARSLVDSVAMGRSVSEAVLAYLRFFTILTNGGVATLMAVTAVALWRRVAPPPAGAYRAATVYMIVTCGAYEMLLRRHWSPQGLQLCSDIIFHDVQPALTVIFWVLCAPKNQLRLTTLPWLISYPAIYFALTIVVGLLGAGYPYDFLDAARLGYPTVLTIGMAFLCVFFGLGAIATTAAGVITGDRWTAVLRRFSSYKSKWGA